MDQLAAMRIFRRVVEGGGFSAALDTSHTVVPRQRSACHAGVRHQAGNEQRLDAGGLQAGINAPAREYADRAFLQQGVVRFRLDGRGNGDSAAVRRKDRRTGRRDVLHIKGRQLVSLCSATGATAAAIVRMEGCDMASSPVVISDRAKE